MIPFKDMAAASLSCCAKLQQTLGNLQISPFKNRRNLRNHMALGNSKSPWIPLFSRRNPSRFPKRNWSFRGGAKNLRRCLPKGTCSKHSTTAFFDHFSKMERHIIISLFLMVTWWLFFLLDIDYFSHSNSMGKSICVTKMNAFFSLKFGVHVFSYEVSPPRSMHVIGISAPHPDVLESQMIKKHVRFVLDGKIDNR